MKIFAILLMTSLHHLCATQTMPSEICYPIPRVVGQSQQDTQNVGRPGKRGPPGLPGPQGAAGSCSCESSELEEIRNDLRNLNEQFQKMVKYHENMDRLAHCPLGLKDGRVSNDDITASSTWRNDQRHLPRYGRLDLIGNATSIGAWAPKDAWKGEWIQVDMQRLTTLTGVITQGRGSSIQQWVTKFKIAVSDDGESFQILLNTNSTEKVFEGNFDKDSHKINMFQRPVTARYVRLIVVAVHGFANLRMEFLTC